MKLTSDLKQRIKSLFIENELEIISAQDIKDEDNEIWYCVQIKSDFIEECFENYLEQFLENNPSLDAEVEYDDEGHTNYLFNKKQ